MAEDAPKESKSYDEGTIKLIVDAIESRSDRSLPISFYEDKYTVGDWQEVVKKLELGDAQGLFYVTGYCRPSGSIFAGQYVSGVRYVPKLTEEGERVILPRVQGPVTVETEESGVPFKPMPEEFPDTRQGREKLRGFLKTERGFVLTHYDGTEAMLSDMRSNVERIRNRSLPLKDRKRSQIDVKYQLALYRTQIPQPLLQEAEACRDLALTTKRKPRLKKR
jgi:hypothetical protein